MKINKKKTALLVLLLFVCNLAFAGVAFATSTSDQKEEKKTFDTGLDPLWQIKDLQVDEQIGVGKEFKVTVTAQNIGSGVAFFPIIEFSQDDKRELTNFTVVGGDNNVYNSNIERVESGETKVFSVTMKVNDETKELPKDSSYKITATLKSNNWDIGSGENPKDPAFGTSKSFNVKPLYQLSNPTFIVSGVTFAPEVTSETETTTATLTVENISDSKARNVTIALDGMVIDEKTGKKNIMVLDLSNTKRLGDMGGKGKTTTSFQLELNDDRKNNEMKMTIKYEGQDKAQEETLNLPLPLDRSGSDTGKIPKVIINKYVVEPSKVLAGNTVKLQLHVENTNSVPVNNVVIKLTVPTSEGNSTTGTTVSGGTVFSPVNSSNTFYIERIEGKSTAVKEISLYVDPNAQAKTYVVPVEIEYEDVDGVTQKGGDNINIPVTQEGKVDIINMRLPTAGNVGMPIDYSVEFVNVGKVNLTNFKASIEGSVPSADSNVYYVGNLEAAVSDTFSGTIFPEAEGAMEGVVVLSYLDADSQEVRLEYPFTVEVGPMIEMPMDPGMEQPMPEESIFSKLKKHAVTIVLALVIAVQAIILFRQKRKAKADEELFNG